MSDEQTPDSGESDARRLGVPGDGSHRARIDGVGNLGEDQPGENLVSPLLPAETAGYVVADDEHEAEELESTGAASTYLPEADADEDVVIDDADQLDDAEEQARVATSSRPVRKAVASTDVLASEELPAAVSTRPVRRSAVVAKKDHATARQRHGAQPEVIAKRVGPVEFVRQSIAELGKVVWPTGSQLIQYFVVVLVFVLFIIAFVSAIDFLAGWLLLKLLG